MAGTTAAQNQPTHVSSIPRPSLANVAHSGLAHTCHEHCARDRSELEASHRQEFAETFLLGTGFGVQNLIDRLRNGQNDAAGTSGHARHGRSKNQVGNT